MTNRNLKGITNFEEKEAKAQIRLEDLTNQFEEAVDERKNYHNLDEVDKEMNEILIDQLSDMIMKQQEQMISFGFRI